MCPAKRCRHVCMRFLNTSGLLTMQGPLTRRDHALIANLRAGALAGEPAWLEELDAMEAMDATAELEALYEHPAGFARLLVDALSAGLFA